MATANVLERANEIDLIALVGGNYADFSRLLADVVKPIEPEPGFIGRNRAHEIDKAAFEHITGKAFDSLSCDGDEDAMIRAQLKRHYLKLGYI